MKSCSCYAIILFFLIPKMGFSQDSITTPLFSISGYVDAYAAFYTDSLAIDEYHKFPSISPRSEQFGLNIAQVSLKYTGEKIRSAVTLHYGDVSRSAWSSTFNFIQEANAGVRVCKKLWIEGGFFRTHVGTEGLFPKENITSSVAVATYYEPYYQAGFKFNYNPSDRLSINLYLLNGYGLYEDNNKKKSAGVLATYMVNDKITLGYSDYVGDDTPEEDTINHLQFYNNFFLNYQYEKIKIVTGINLGVRQHANLKDVDKSASMFSGLFALQYNVCPNWNLYGRAEIFQDPQGYLSGSFYDTNNNLAGLKIWGLTLGAEYKPITNGYIRIEARDLMAAGDQDIFYWNGESRSSRFEAMLNLGVWFP